MPGVRTEKAEEPVIGSSSDSKMASELSGSQTLSSFLGPSTPLSPQPEVLALMPLCRRELTDCAWLSILTILYLLNLWG